MVERERRGVFLADLERYVVQTRRTFETLANRLDWTPESLSENATASLSNDSSLCVSTRKRASRRRDVDSNEPASSKFFYEKSKSVTSVRIGKALRRRIIECDREQKEKRKEESTIRENSLEDANMIPPVFKTALEEIEYIYSWSQIPIAYSQLTLTSLEPNFIKGWIVNHLPESTQSLSSASQLDQIHFIYSSLCVCRPDALVARLTPRLAARETRQFVLSLWKFLAFSLIATKNEYSKDEIDDAKLRGQVKLKAEQSDESKPSLVSSLANEDKNEQGVDDDDDDEDDSSSSLSPLSLDERRAVYDYVVEKSRLESSGKRVADMNELLVEATEDFERVKAKLQPREAATAAAADESGVGGKTYNEQMAIMRDYKRRRQSYRAKNTRITKRTPTQILRDLIDVRMEILAPARKGDAEPDRKRERRRRRHSTPRGLS
ncbi:uncharacterized protein [Oscarella lobularis]|uniref:uncharacterized protein n=1 Tax=Oscarella lobularis TaxID=121494 RepID=UPI0033132706